MLKIQGLCKVFNPNTVNENKIFDNFSIDINKGDFITIIGSNGAGKSTFLRIISGDLESTKGGIIIGKNERISVLKQNHNEFNDYTVLETVIMGNKELYRIMKAKEALYMKEDFSDEDGIKVAELEAKFDEMNGWQAESDAAILLSGLGIENDLLEKTMSELKDKEKVKVLLARALFGNPDILLLDEPTNFLDEQAEKEFLSLLHERKGTTIVVSHDTVCCAAADVVLTIENGEIRHATI